MKKMRNCPFCKKEIDADHFVYGVYYHKDLDLYIFDHVCHIDTADLDICVTIYGKTKKEVINRWNGVQDEDEESESL